MEPFPGLPSLTGAMLISRRKLLLMRVLPLAAVGTGVIALIPADFEATANVVAPAAQAAQAPVAAPSVEITMPAPQLKAAPSLEPSVQAEVKVAAVEAPQPTISQIQPTDAPSDGVGIALPDGTRAGRVGGSDVNVRASGSTQSDVLFTLRAGTSVQIAETSGGWDHVYADVGDGWVYSGLLSDGTAPARPTQAADTSFDPPASGLRLRSATPVYDRPGGTRIYVLDRGERVGIAQSAGNWARIVTDTDESGWIRIG